MQTLELYGQSGRRVKDNRNWTMVLSVCQCDLFTQLSLMSDDQLIFHYVYNMECCYGNIEIRTIPPHVLHLLGRSLITVGGSLSEHIEHYNRVHILSWDRPSMQL